MLHHIAIICSDEKSVEFYSLLGFTEEKRIERPEHHDIIVWLRGNGVMLELFIDSTHPQRVTNPEANGLRHLAFSVGDVDGCLSELRDKGVEEISGYKIEPIRVDSTTGEQMTFIKDPDGLPIEIRE